jgi:hypothetical protein
VTVVEIIAPEVVVPRIVIGFNRRSVLPCVYVPGATRTISPEDAFPVALETTDVRLGSTSQTFLLSEEKVSLLTSCNRSVKPPYDTFHTELLTWVICAFADDTPVYTTLFARYDAVVRIVTGAYEIVAPVGVAFVKAMGYVLY